MNFPPVLPKKRAISLRKCARTITQSKSHEGLARRPKSKFRVICRSAIVMLTWSGFSAFGTVYNSDGSAQNVQYVHDNLAQGGDTITVPAGTFTWTTGVHITKAITLQGQGIGTTIVTDAYASSSPLISVTLVASFVTRITGIEFQDGGGSLKLGGYLSFTGSNTNGGRMRLDHCKSNNVNGMITVQTCLGVIDHCDLYRGNLGANTIVIHDKSWNGGNNGDSSWSDATQFGSGNFLFIEDCTYTDATTNQSGITDGYEGARFVVRHSQINNGTVQTHGTESNGRPRGSRAIEVYNNTFTGSNINRFLGGVRSGVGLFHDNQASGYWSPNTTFDAVNYRDEDYFVPWGGADGLDVWDVNSAPSATFTATSVGTQTCTVSGTSWSTNQWVGYTIRKDNLGGFNGSYPWTSIWFATVTGNTANTVTWNSACFSTMTMNVGDTFKFYRVNQVVDGVGRARGDLLVDVQTNTTSSVTLPASTIPVVSTSGFPPPYQNMSITSSSTGFFSCTGISGNSFTGCTGGTGSFPSGSTIRSVKDSVTGTETAPNQVTEPCYAWNNIDEHGNQVPLFPHSVTVRVGEHIINGQAMPGYTPYIYPHPLVSGDPPGTPTPTPTASPTPTSTFTPTPTPTASPTPTSTFAPTPTPTPPDPSPTPTPFTPTPTPTPGCNHSITSNDATWDMGIAGSYQITVGNSNHLRSYNATGLPPGLTVHTNNGVISGTPTTIDTYSVTLSAVYNNCTAFKTVTFTVVQATPSPTPTASPTPTPTPTGTPMPTPTPRHGPRHR